MDLEHSKAWLGLAQQPYAIIAAFLEQLSNLNADQNKVIESTNNHPLTNPINPVSLIQTWLKRHSCIVDQYQIQESLEWLKDENRQLLTFDQFPDSLKAINSPPALLYLEGNPSLLFQQSIAIVGSRKPTHSGREMAAHFSTSLAEHGFTIISGMALGIDGIAHQSALDIDGKTVAVLGCGHHYCYPKTHSVLFETLKRCGLVVSEFHPGTAVKAYQFPRRNRIISGLSLGVLVVEAAIKSGSLITCKIAADQGREVFAIPGDIRNPLSQGCHLLIQQGAQLVDDPAQIIASLNFNEAEPVMAATRLNSPTSKHDNGDVVKLNTKNQWLVLNCIDTIPTNINRIVERSGLEMKLVLSVLFSLELENKVQVLADGYCRL